MPRLTIAADTIDFINEGVNFTAHVARLIAEEDVIFIVKYSNPEVNVTDMRRIKRNFSEAARKFLWFNYPDNKHDTFIQVIGEEIEKRPHLLTVTS